MSGTPPPPYSADYGQQSKVPPSTQYIGDGFPPSPQFSSIYSGTAPPQPPNPTPIVTRVIHARTSMFGPLPVEMDCQYCQNHIVTHTTHVPGPVPWIIMAVCFVLGFFLVIPWCLCCVPFCIDSCLDVLHHCPTCKRVVGRFSRL